MAHHLPMKVSFLFPSYFQVMSQRQDSLTFRWCPEGRTPLLSGDAPKAGLPYFQGMSRIHCIMAQLKVPSFTVAGLLYFQVMSPCCIMAQLKVPSFTAAQCATGLNVTMPLPVYCLVSNKGSDWHPFPACPALTWSKLVPSLLHPALSSGQQVVVIIVHGPRGVRHPITQTETHSTSRHGEKVVIVVIWIASIAK